MKNINVLLSMLILMFAGWSKAQENKISFQISCDSPYTGCDEISYFGQLEKKTWVTRQPELMVGEIEITEAEVTDGPYGHPEIAVSLTKEAADKFATATGNNIGKRLALVYNKMALSEPVIQASIHDGRFVITTDPKVASSFVEAVPWLKKMSDEKKSAADRKRNASLLIYALIGVSAIVGAIYFAFVRKTKTET